MWHLKLNPGRSHPTAYKLEVTNRTLGQFLEPRITIDGRN